MILLFIKFLYAAYKLPKTYVESLKSFFQKVFALSQTLDITNLLQGSNLENLGNVRYYPKRVLF